MKTTRKKIIYLAVFVALMLALSISLPVLVISEKPTKVACVGDSITYGYGVRQTRDQDSYPAYLQEELGNKYRVFNYGNNGSTILKDGNKPYVKQNEYNESKKVKANIYLFMLGTNDSKPINWNKSETSFTKDLKALVSEYVNLKSKPKVIMMQPTKSFRQIPPEDPSKIDDELIRNDIHVAIKNVADSFKLPVINLYDFTKDHPEWFPDNLHPNKEGNKKISHYIYHQVHKLTNLW